MQWKYGKWSCELTGRSAVVRCAMYDKPLEYGSSGCQPKNPMKPILHSTFKLNHKTKRYNFCTHFIEPPIEGRTKESTFSLKQFFICVLLNQFDLEQNDGGISTLAKS